MFYKGGGSGANSIPLNTNGTHTQQLLEPSDFNIPPFAGLITKIYMKNSVAAATGTYTDFSVGFVQNNNNAFLNTTFLTGVTNALTATTFTITGNATAQGWFEIPLTTPFAYDPAQSLIVEIKYASKTGGITVATTTASTSKRLFVSAPPGAATGGLTTGWADFGMDIVPSTACTNPLLAGTTSVSSIVACAGQTIDLNLSGNSIGNGLSYQWEFSTNNVSYTGIGTALSFPFFQTIINNTGWYRCKLVCSGGTPVYSNPVKVTVMGALSGIYTINNGAPTAGTNFNRFADALTILNCSGVSGPVTFNVVPGTPYTERLEFGNIPGVSAVNTVRVNGNGATVQFANTSVNRVILTLNGTKHTRIDSLNFIALDATFGMGAHITNGALNDSITRCNFDLSGITVAGSGNTNGIMFAATNTSPTAAGINGSHCYIANNYIKGADSTGGMYYGISIASGGNDSNIIVNNTIENYSYYGIQVAASTGNKVISNKLLRPDKTGSLNVANYGIYLTSGLSAGHIIDGNRIYSNVSSSAIATGTFYGIGSAAKATAGNPIIISNNAIYDVAGTIMYGLYTSGTDYNRFYHNTVDLGRINSNANLNYGIYATATCIGTEFVNNNISITGGGTDIKYGFFYNSPTATSNSQKNNFYLNSSQPGTQNYGYWTTAYTTQSAFQTAYPVFEIGSPLAQPQYTNPATGDFTPSNAALTSAGNNLLAVVSNDINGLSRASTPTIGAFEKLPTGSNDAATVALISPVGNICAATVPVEVSFRNAGIDNINTLQINWKLNGVLQTPYIYTGTLVPSTASGINMDTVTLGNAVLISGANAVQVWTSLPNGLADQNTANDTLTATITTSTFTLSPNLDTICGIGTAQLQLAPATGYGASSVISWEWSENAGATWNVVAGANSSNYTVSGITATRQYRAKIINNSVVCNSATATVTLGNAAITGTTGAERCGQGTVILTATPAGGTVRWYNAFGGGNLLHTGTSFTTPNIVTTTTYYAEAVLSTGCKSARVPVVATVNPIPVVNLGIDTSICSSGMTLNAGNAGASYLWNDATTAQTKTVTTSGQYHVTVTANNCSASDTVNISVIPAPAGDFTSVEGANRTVTFNATATGATTYNWNYGNGNTGTGNTVSHQYQSNGSYTVTLTLGNECGDETQIIKTVNVGGTGINSVLDDKNIECYPNPATNQLSIENKGTRNISNIIIIDALGRTINTVAGNGRKKITIDVSKLNSGLYSVVLQTEDGNMTRKFLIAQ